MRERLQLSRESQVNLRRAFAGLIALALAQVLSGCAVVPVAPDLPEPGYAPRRIINPLRPVLGLVLGSGASRGFAHVGVIQVLEANGVFPDLIVGTSSGALVGALYAGGNNGKALEPFSAADARKPRLRRGRCAAR